jgi:hypothetical protein
VGVGGMGIYMFACCTHRFLYPVRSMDKRQVEFLRCVAIVLRLADNPTLTLAQRFWGDHSKDLSRLYKVFCDDLMVHCVCQALVGLRSLTFIWALGVGQELTCSALSLSLCLSLSLSLSLSLFSFFFLFNV